MFTKKIAVLSLSLAFIFHSTASFAEAPLVCPRSLAMSVDETESFQLFNAKLSHLLDAYGKPNFEKRLSEIVSASLPGRQMAAAVSPLYFERLQNLVDQARLKNAVALTIGLDSLAWQNFEYHIRNITLHRRVSHNLMNPFDRSAIAVMREIKEKTVGKGKDLELKGVEAISRLGGMFAQLQRLRVANGEIRDAEADAMARTVAVAGIGLIGAGVVYSTLFISAPLLATAGAAAGSLASLGEIAAGGLIGLVGAPGARTAFDAYHTLSESYKQSLNNDSSFNCELGQQIGHWKSVARDHLVSAAILGSGMAVGGGTLTLVAAGSKAVLAVTFGGVMAAQGYSIVKLGEKTYLAISHFEMARAAEEAGDLKRARELTLKARDYAQEAGDKALESIIIGTLTNHVLHHARHAYHEGASAIRKLYAASADTLPTAALAAADLVKALVP